MIEQLIIENNRILIMSLSYAESLSYFPHKGKVGMPELDEKPDDLKSKEIIHSVPFDSMIFL